jgi:hypothetical protein
VKHHFLRIAIVGLLFLIPSACGDAPSRYDAPLLQKDQRSAVEALTATAKHVTCGAAGAAALTVSAVAFHEDSTISAHIDLHALTPLSNWQTIGVFIETEDGVPYHPAGAAFDIGASLQALTPGACFDRAFPNLNPDKTYQVCLNGLTSALVSTGPFDCTSIKTAKAKPETALLVTNSNASAIQSSIDSWRSIVLQKHSTLTIKQIKVSDTISAQDLWTILQKQYNTSNLTTVILGSPNLPIPAAPVAYTGVYRSLTRGYMADDGFLNPTDSLNEISIAFWNAQNASALKAYLARVVKYYKGSLHYARRMLFANAMTPADLPLTKSDLLGGRYSDANIDYVGGITAYLDDAQGKPWRAHYAELLDDNSYEQVLLDAHGATTFHYPCDSGGCVDAPFIRKVNPRAMFIVALSCNIGNLGVPESPMDAYVFEGESLGGIGAEVLNFGNADELKIIETQISASVPIGKAARMWGFTAFGDPFLQLPK